MLALRIEELVIGDAGIEKGFALHGFPQGVR
jgi:hypothetical protein